MMPPSVANVRAELGSARQCAKLRMLDMFKAGPVSQAALLQFGGDVEAVASFEVVETLGSGTQSACSDDNRSTKRPADAIVAEQLAKESVDLGRVWLQLRKLMGFCKVVVA